MGKPYNNPGEYPPTVEEFPEEVRKFRRRWKRDILERNRYPFSPKP